MAKKSNNAKPSNTGTSPVSTGMPGHPGYSSPHNSTGGAAPAPMPMPKNC